MRYQQSFVKASTPLVLNLGEQAFPLQDVFNKICPGLLPLLVVVGVYIFQSEKGHVIRRPFYDCLVLGWFLDRPEYCKAAI